MEKRGTFGHKKIYAATTDALPASLRSYTVIEGKQVTVTTNYDHTKRYDLKGAVVASGIKHLTGFDMPVYPKRRFQHGAVKPDQLKSFLRTSEPVMRRRLQELFN
ncbi:hypothetical protein GC207_04170 [bacterium]|nr:hypothetical protein [bacterium]